jgi:hypothetical protein
MDQPPTDSFKVDPAETVSGTNTEKFETVDPTDQTTYSYDKSSRTGTNQQRKKPLELDGTSLDSSSRNYRISIRDSDALIAASVDWENFSKEKKEKNLRRALEEERFISHQYLFYFILFEWEIRRQLSQKFRKEEASEKMYMVVLYFNNVVQCHEVDKKTLKCRYICSKNIGCIKNVNSVGVRFTVLKQEGKHL